jgi:Spy/CpxP family protein refolding chaperone
MKFTNFNKFTSHPKGKFIVLSVLFVLSFFSFAKSQNNEKIYQAKYAFISSKIELRPEQEQKFWPIYNDYQDKKIDLKRQIQHLRIDAFNKTASDEQIKNDLNLFFELKKKETELESNYYQKFMKILSVRQTSELLKAERDFIKILYKKLEE